MWPDSDPTNHPGEGYIPPGPSHEEFLFDRSHLTYFVAGGERGAKSWTTAAKAALLTIEFIQSHPKEANGLVAWVVANTYELTNVEMVECLEPFLATVIPGTRLYKNNQHWEIEVPTGLGGKFIIRTKSALDPETLRAEAPVWVLLCEVALVAEEAYGRLYGRMGQRRGQFPGFGQLILGGTFEGAVSWYPAMWTEFQSPEAARRAMTMSISLPSHENEFAWPGGINNPQLLDNRRVLTESEYLERHDAIPAPPSHRVHDRFDPKIHVRECKYDPDLTVYLGNDPGYAHPNAVVVVQKHERFTNRGDKWIQWQAIDEIFIAGKTVQEVCDIAMDRFWWKNPNKVGVVDIAGRNHAGQQEPYAQIWQQKTGMSLMAEPVRIQPGIDRLNSMLSIDPVGQEPKFIIDPVCRGLIGELGGGPYPLDGKLHVYAWHLDRTGVRSGKVPRDEYNDAIKAVTYLFTNLMGILESHQGQRKPHVRRFAAATR